MWRLLIFLVAILYTVYYATVIMQFLLGIAHFTNRKLTLFRTLVPFYFWFAPANENSVPEKPRVKPIKRKESDDSSINI